MATKLRELLDDASNQVDTYKHPAIGEFCIEISKVLRLTGQGGIGDHDEVTSISEHQGTVSIETAWSVRQCAQTSSYELPSSIIDAEDPQRAALIWHSHGEIVNQRRVVASLQGQLAQAEKNLASLLEAQKDL